MPPKLRDWYGQTGEAPANDESIYTLRAANEKTLAMGKQSTKLGLLLMMVVTMNADAGLFDHSKGWKEEVQLHDGRVIVVERLFNLGGYQFSGKQYRYTKEGQLIVSLKTPASVGQDGAILVKGWSAGADLIVGTTTTDRMRWRTVAAIVNSSKAANDESIYIRRTAA
jgi:major membrane immunogen (membrane-anchored lipoprotein)